jgi:hypothetical protein
MPDGNGRLVEAARLPGCFAVFLLSSASYLPGVLVLAHSLRKHHSKFPLIVLYNEKVPHKALDVLRAYGLAIRPIEMLLPAGEVTTIAERFVDTWAKMRVFELIEYEVRRRAQPFEAHTE